MKISLGAFWEAIQNIMDPQDPEAREALKKSMSANLGHDSNATGPRLRDIISDLPTQEK